MLQPRETPSFPRAITTNVLRNGAIKRWYSRGALVGGGAVAHLVGQLATIQDVRGSILRPGQIRFSLLLCVHPTLNGYLGLLRPGDSKGGEESNDKLPQMPYAKNNQDPTPGFPMLGLSVGPTNFTVSEEMLVLIAVTTTEL
ncbi:hypothetical protein PoB_004959500 [Plakobranchus ocellatus]|uniref:Uncharacterized protein n=1 Tax=Plakobranchus ocellatus TaxID=259542 RepID=A0AAV4BUV4_9GAST|nr:hypothetical protein PoB_004959500 [Plakobranchus ocellatus]